MKCPFRIKTVKGSRLDKEEITQEFEECYGEECAAVKVVQHLGSGGEWRIEVVGCCMMKG